MKEEERKAKLEQLARCAGLAEQAYDAMYEAHSFAQGMTDPKHIAILAHDIRPGKHHLFKGLLIADRRPARIVVGSDGEINSRSFGLNERLERLHRLGADDHNGHTFVPEFRLKAVQVGDGKFVGLAQGAEDQNVNIGAGLDCHRLALDPCHARQGRGGITELVVCAAHHGMVCTAHHGSQRDQQRHEKNGKFIHNSFIALGKTDA